MSSLGKAAVATGLLLLVSLSSFRWWAILCYVAVLAIGYGRELSERRSVRISFALASALGLLGFSALRSLGADAAPFSHLVLSAIFFGITFALFGLMNLAFKERRAICAAVHTVLLFGAGAWALSISAPVLGGAPPLSEYLPVVVALAVGALSYEYLAFLLPVFRGRLPALAASLGFVGGQLFFMLRFLPLGFVNAAVLFALVLTLARDGVAAHAMGTLTPPFIFRSLTLLTVVFVLVLAFSRWSI